MRTLIIASLLGATALGGIAYANQSTTGPAESVTRAEFLDRAGKTFDRLDTDKNGTLSRTERKAGRHHRGAMGGPFLAAQDGPPPPPTGEGRRGGGRGMGGMGADADKDGKITRAEQDAQAAKMFQRMDANADGAIDATEMAALPGGGRMAQRLDGDGDGKVTRAEYDKQTAERFARMDANGDGVIDAAERPQPRGGARRGGATPTPQPTPGV